MQNSHNPHLQMIMIDEEPYWEGKQTICKYDLRESKCQNALNAKQRQVPLNHWKTESPLPLSSKDEGLFLRFIKEQKRRRKWISLQGTAAGDRWLLTSRRDYRARLWHNRHTLQRQVHYALRFLKMKVLGYQGSYSNSNIFFNRDIAKSIESVRAQQNEIYTVDVTSFILNEPYYCSY